MNENRAFFAVMVLCLSSLASTAQSSDAASLVDALAKIRDFEQAAISPDGTQVAWVEMLHDANGAPSRNTAVFCQSRQQGARPTRITVAAGRDARERNLAWAPDSKQLAFLSDAEHSGQEQLYISDCKGSAPKRVSSLNGYVADPLWSPDDRHIAVLYTEGSSAGSDPLEASPPRVGKIEEEIAEQRIAIVDPATAQMRLVSPAEMYIYEYDWSPDGSRFVVTSAPGSGENNWWIAQLYTMSAVDGKMNSIYKPPLQIAVPRWSPDGKSVAFIYGLMSDEVSTGGDIYVIPASGGEPRNVTPQLRGSVSSLGWTRTGQILFVQDSRGRTVVSQLTPGGSHIQDLWSGDDFLASSAWMASVSVADGGKTVATVRSSFQKPPEVVSGTIGDLKPITSGNASALVPWGKFESIEWKSDQYDVQGWLVFPKSYDPSRKYPMVVDIHGGPASVRTAGWPTKHHFLPILLSSEGYFVFLPNPRGSYGQGEDFTKANVKDYGYGDLRDIMRGVDAVIARYPVDPNRLGVTGWSYGGFMTMWTVTQTNRFRAAVAGAGIANWQSYYGENEIDTWMIPYFGASVYDDPAVYAKSSPITFIKQVKTPTLVVVGQYDAECPSPQSFEFWHALKTLNVPTSMIVYPGEGHEFHAPANRRDVNVQTINWFNRYLSPGGATATGH